MVTSRGPRPAYLRCRCVFFFGRAMRLETPAGVSERRRIIALWQTQEVPEKPACLAFSFAIRPKSCQKLSLQGNYVNSTDIISRSHGEMMTDRSAAAGKPIRTAMSVEDGIDFAIIELFF